VTWLADVPLPADMLLQEFGMQMRFPKFRTSTAQPSSISPPVSTAQEG
jgi:hypothetical protein